MFWLVRVLGCIVFLLVASYSDFYMKVPDSIIQGSSNSGVSAMLGCWTHHRPQNNSILFQNNFLEEGGHKVSLIFRNHEPQILNPSSVRVTLSGLLAIQMQLCRAGPAVGICSSRILIVAEATVDFQ